MGAVGRAWLARMVGWSLAVLPAAAQAQTAPAAPSQPPGGAAPAPSGAGTAADADDPSAAAPAKPVIPATGYSYGGDTAAPASPSTRPPAERPRARPAAPPDPLSAEAVMPGFETLPTGSTRLFVQLSKAAEFDARPTRANVTYVLKGVRVDRRNNLNPLVTVHFNTPATSARLVPHGRDTWLVVDLRANVQPTASMSTDKAGAAVLSVEFPKGAYLPATPALAPGEAPDEGGAESAPAPRAKAAPDRVPVASRR